MGERQKSPRLLALLLALTLLGGCAGSGRKAEAPRTDSPRPESPRYESSSAQKPGPAVTSPPAAPTSQPPAGQRPPADMYFQDPGENPMVNTSKKPVSTFSVDVDTASFTVVRNYLSRGMLPPPEAVRIEEFLNFFPQNYPRSQEPVAVYIEGAPNPFRPQMHLVQIGLKAKEISRAARKPAVLTFVVDVSGSMEMESRLALVKKSLRLLIDQLEKDDRLGIVIYGSRGQVLLEHTADHAKILRAIDSLTPGGSTNFEEGLFLGYDLAARAFQKGAINRVILCSDGVANVGRTDPEQLLRQITEYRDQGITLTTVGFGMGNYNDVLMERLADKGDGQYAYVDTLDEAKRIFAEQLTSTLQLVAKDTKVQVYFDPEQVASYRLVGYENRVMKNEEFRNDKADAGDMGAGHTVTALYEVMLIGRGSLLGSVSIRYKEPDSGAVTEQGFDIRRRHLTSTASARLAWSASVAEFGGILGKSPWAMESSLDQVLRTARRAAGDLGSPESHRTLLAMIEEARELIR